MYERFYGFVRKPFELVPNPQFLYMSETHRKALSYLEYGVKSRAGFILLTGEIGSGKTTIIRSLLDRFESKTIPARVFNTKVNATQLLFMINEDFGISSRPKDKMSMLSELNEFLIQKFANNEKPTLIVDEAQNLTPACLEEIRLLSNLESGDTKLLQIILVGQPELNTVIDQPGLQQLRQRISVNCHLGCLSKNETREYFLHRLKCAGNANALVFPEQSFEMIYKATGGVPRLINIVGDYLLLAGFSEATYTPDLKMVEEVLNDIKDNIAFRDVAEVDSSVKNKNQNQEGTDEEHYGVAHETLDNILFRLQKHENVIRKIIKKHISETVATRHQIDDIDATLVNIEETLKLLYQIQSKESAHQPRKSRINNIVTKLKQ